jgi:hypothetical protein
VSLTCLVHTVLGKKANRSSSLSQVVNYFDSSPSLSDRSVSVLDSPLRKLDRPTPRRHASFYHPRENSDSDSDSDEEIRDVSPEVAEPNTQGIRDRSRSLKSAIAPRRWPDRLKGSESSGSSGGMVTSGSNSTTSLPGQQEGRQGSPDFNVANNGHGSMSDIGSEDIPMTRLSVSRNMDYEQRNSSPFVSPF